MTKVEFKKIINTAFVSGGFRVVEKRLRLDGTDAVILADLQKSQYGEDYFINIGFWLRALAGQVPSKVERCHMYYRLESLFPEWGDQVKDGSQLTLSGQPEAAARLAAVILHECAPVFVELANSERAIRTRFIQGGFNQGLILKVARAYLDGPALGPSSTSSV